MTETPDGSADARRNEYLVRVMMGEPPLRAASAIPMRDRETSQSRRRIAREWLRRWCTGCVGYRA